MTTHELELTEPVDLCVADGSSLNPSARGWSRRPLHRANLHGCFGVNKRWDYWAVLAGDLVISAVYSNIDHFGLADVWWVDLVTGETGGQGHPDARRCPRAAGAPGDRAAWSSTETASICAWSTTSPAPGSLASWVEADGRHGRLDVLVELPAGHESLNVVIPWSDTVFNFTSKHQARPAVGHLTVGDRGWSIGGPTVRSRGACSTSAGAGGPTRSPGTGAAARAAPAATSSACRSAPSGPRGRGSPRTG